MPFTVEDTVELLKKDTPDFIAPTLGPPNSPDLNPVDYSVWEILQERVYSARIADIADRVGKTGSRDHCGGNSTVET